jgi:hypothetical protein
MALSIERLKSLLEGENLKYFLDPAMDKIMLGATGANGSYQLLILLEVEDTFIQFRSMSYLSCPEDHEHVVPVLKVLGELNYKLRFLKFGWDPSDGEIVVYGDAWLEDGDLTQKQFGRMIHAYLTMMDLNYLRLDKTIKTGKDPGEIRPTGSGGAPSGLPPEMQELLDRLLEGVAGDGDADDEGETGILDSI